MSESFDYKIKDYESNFRPTFCPGCGNFSQYRAIRQALVELELPPEEVVLVSGIGCASHMPNFIKVYGLQTVHGRGIPVATGIRLANPKLTVLVYAGDGDVYGIGGNHFLHSCRRNVDIITIVSNNFVYGLTTGQASATTPVGTLTRTTPRGSIENPINPVAVALSAGATFVGRGFSGDLKHLSWLLKEAINHRGFAYVDVFSPCITFNHNQTFDYFRDKVYKVEDSGHNKEDFHAALELANQLVVKDKLPIGIFYQIEHKTTYEERDFALNQGIIPAQSPLELTDEQIEVITKEFY